MAVFQFHQRRVDASVALRHVDDSPGLTFVVRDAERRGVSRKTVLGIAADPGAHDPAAVGEYLDGLAAEGPLLREQHFRLLPGPSEVPGGLAPDDGGVLHVVLAFHPVQLGGVEGPYLAVGVLEKAGVLLAALRVVGHPDGRLPPAASLGEPGADYADVGVSLKGAGEPHAQQVAVLSLQEPRAVGGVETAGGQECLQRAEILVLIDDAVRHQLLQRRIIHFSSS